MPSSIIMRAQCSSATVPVAAGPRLQRFPPVAIRPARGLLVRSSGTYSAQAQPTPAELVKYGELCEVTYDNFRVSDQELPAAMSSLTSKIVTHLRQLGVGHRLFAAGAADAPGAPMTDLDPAETISEDVIPLGYKYGQPWYFISVDEATKRGQLSGLPVWQPADWAQQYWGYKDLWSFSGLDNLNAPPLLLGALRAAMSKPSWAGYIVYRKPAQGDAADHGELVMAFRGTQLKSEWLSDLATGVTLFQTPEYYDPKRPEMGQVHKGFHHIYAAAASGSDPATKVPKQVVEEVLQAAKSQQGPFKGQPFPRVTTTGHSLGGGLATLCALHVADWLQRNGVPTSKEDVTAITYDAPCVGDEKLAGQIDRLATVWRVVNANDIVPRVPPTGQCDIDFITKRAEASGLDKVKLAALKAALDVTRLLNWQHAGQLLAYDPTALGHQMGQQSPWDPNRTFSIGENHNLQLLLYVIAQEAGLAPDPTSINKGDNILKHELNVPPSFWQPVPIHKGLKKAFPYYVPPGCQPDVLKVD